MSQAGRPRPRYIAVVLHADEVVSRKAFQNALTGKARKAGVPEDQLPRLTRYRQPDAIVWSDHRTTPEVRKVLESMSWAIEGDRKVPLRVETVLTSGTIMALTDRTRKLTKRDEPKPPKHKRRTTEPSEQAQAATPSRASKDPARRARHATSREGHPKG